MSIGARNRRFLSKTISGRESNNAQHAWGTALKAAGFEPKQPIPDLIEKRERDPSAGSEHKEQAKVIRWWDGTRDRAGAHVAYKLPHFALYAVPNGGFRTQMGGWALKAEGVRSGILDLGMDVARGKYHGWRAEMKYGRNKESEAQIEVGLFLRSQGYFVGTFWSADDCIDSLIDYLEGKL